MTERNSARFSYKDHFMLTYPGGRLPMEIGSPLSGSRLTCLNANENSFGFDRKIDILIKTHQRKHLSSPVSINDESVIDELDAQGKEKFQYKIFGRQVLLDVTLPNKVVASHWLNTIPFALGGL